MKILSDLFALILFFSFFSVTKNIYWATACAVVIGVLQAAFIWMKHKKLDVMQWASLILIVVFGGATIVFRDDTFIKWKPTLLFWLGAVVLLVCQLRGKNGLKSMMGKELVLPEPVWNRLTMMWMAFLVLLGVVNLVVAYQFSQQAWVNYKLFGSTGLMILFMLAQGFYLSRYLPQENK